MAQRVELWITLNQWDPHQKGWPIYAFSGCRGFRCSSLRTNAGEIPANQWELDSFEQVPIVKWKVTANRPDDPIGIVTFPSPRGGNHSWTLVKNINKLTSILLLIGTLGTAYFAYLGSTSQKELDRLNQKIQKWHVGLEPAQCSEETDAERAVTECVSKYAKDKQSLIDTQRRLEALLPVSATGH